MQMVLVFILGKHLKTLKKEQKVARNVFESKVVFVLKTFLFCQTTVYQNKNRILGKENHR